MWSFIKQIEGRVLTMAVLIEAFSVVIRIETIEAKYPGGIAAYKHICPEQNFCCDNSITSRIGFPTLDQAEEFVGILEDIRFLYNVDGDFDEIAIVDQWDGIILPCNWLEFGFMEFARLEGRVPVCKSRGCTSMSMSVTPSWLDAYSQGRRCEHMEIEDAEKRWTFLRHENGCDFYYDVLTGQELYFPRSIRRKTNA
jgi:hypothetical protein